jgi:hypothetical protein
MNLRDREIRLRSFLGFNESVRLELILPNEIPSLQVDPQEVLNLAMANNPEILEQQLTILQAQSSMAQAKSERGFNANNCIMDARSDPDFRFLPESNRHKPSDWVYNAHFDWDWEGKVQDGAVDFACPG